MTRRGAQRAAGVTAVLCAFLLVTGQPAGAAVAARSVSAAQQVSSAQWASVATSATAPPYGSGPFTLSFGASMTQSILFQVANSGQLDLTGATYTLSGTNLPRNAQVTVYACFGGTWDLAAGGCVGGVMTAIVSSTGTAVRVSVSTAGQFAAVAGTTIQLVGYVSKSPSTSTTATLTVEVSRAQVRPARTLSA